MQRLMLIVVIVSLVAGATLALIGWNQSRARSAALDWPTAQARITRSETMRQSRSRAGFSSRGASITAGSEAVEAEVWRARVEYEFLVAGERYGGQRPTFELVSAPVAEHAEPPATIRAIVARYAPGDEVAVRYDPEDPDENFIEMNGPTGRILLWPGIALLLIGAALGLRMLS